MREIAKHGYSYFLSSRSHGKETAKSVAQFTSILEQHGDHYRPHRMGILLSAYVSETDAQAQAEAMDALAIHTLGYNVCLVFFGVHCLVLGYLLARSAIVPRVIGALFVLPARWRRGRTDLTGWVRACRRRHRPLI